MRVIIAPQYTQRILSWGDWKIEVARRDGIHQAVEDSSLYTVWFYDGPDVFIVYLPKGTIPDTEVALGRTQEEIDAERAEFEADYLETANGVLDRKAPSNKLPGIAPAKGLGGYLPNPSNNPYQPTSEESVSLYVDGEGSLVARGNFLTDEGSYRSDFNQPDLVTVLNGTIQFTSGSQRVQGTGTFFTTEISRTGYIRPLSGDDNNWCKVARIINDTAFEIDTPYVSASVSGDLLLQTEAVPVAIGDVPGTLVVSGGHVIANPGLLSGSGIGLWRQADYGPMYLYGWISITQRLPDQEIWFGFRDPENLQSPSIFADLVFSGSDNTKVLFRTGFLGESEETEITLLDGYNTEDKIRYRILVTPEACTAEIGKGGVVVEHDLHIPAPYDELVMGGAIENLGAVTTETEFKVDCVLFRNFDRLDT